MSMCQQRWLVFKRMIVRGYVVQLRFVSDEGKQRANIGKEVAVINEQKKNVYQRCCSERLF